MQPPPSYEVATGQKPNEEEEAKQNENNQKQKRTTEQPRPTVGYVPNVNYSSTTPSRSNDCWDAFTCYLCVDCCTDTVGHGGFLCCYACCTDSDGHCQCCDCDGGCDCGDCDCGDCDFGGCDC